MSGWNLKEGALVTADISEDEIWSLFNFVFSEACKKTNTYKFGLIKSICDQVYDIHNNGTGLFLSYEKIFSKFAENYWKLVNKYQLRQMFYNGKSENSKIESILQSAVESYAIPENVEFQSLSHEDRGKIIKNVTMECKKCVVGALYNDFEGKLYAFDLRGAGIFFSEQAYAFLSKYKMEIEKLNYYAWARFLEKVNDDNALIRVLKKLDMATPRRKDLSMYKDILMNEFQENNCFYCEKQLDKNIHVDHFIPWSFVKNDNLWNFVLSCPKCNLKKSGKLMGERYLAKIELRNSTILSKMPSNSPVRNEFEGYYDGLLDRMWSYAKMSGVRERKETEKGDNS